MISKLTKQENIIARMIAQGYSEKEIAMKLFRSYETIHAHSRNLRKKNRC